jgi:dipeptidyl-peptidase-4
MNTRTAAALAAAALAAGGLLPADPPKGPALDTSFLKLYAETRGFTLGRPQKPKITPDGKHVLFLRAEAKTPKLKLFEFDVAAGTTRELLSPEALLKGADENLTPEEKARRERQRVSVGGFTDYHLDPAGGRVLVKLSNRLYVFDRTAGKATELKTGTDGAVVDPKWSPDGSKVAYVRGFDVYVYDLSTGKESAVTTGGTAVKTHGLAEFVAQEEMGRHSGYWWSPDGKSIAYAEADHTGVEVWWIADPLRPDVKPQEQFYPRPGKKNVAVRLGIVPVAGGETVWVDPGKSSLPLGNPPFEPLLTPSFEYLAAVKWDKRGGLTIQVQDRRQQELRLMSVAPDTGKSRTLLAETSPAWINLAKDLPTWDDRGRFLWISDRDGDARLYLVNPEDTSDHRMRPLTPPGLQVSELVTLTEFASPTPGETILSPIIQATDDPTQAGVWQVGNLRREPSIVAQHLKPLGPGLASVVTTKEGTPRVYTRTSLTALPTTFVEQEATGAKGRVTIPSVAAEPPFVPNVTIEKVGDYWTAIVRPRDFDPKKKYPVVLDVYGGPRHLHVVRAMRNWLVPQWLADQGFVVVAVDNRGTPGRGRDWEKAIYKKFGTVPLEDQVKGLHALCDKFPELDRDRVGAAGWSFGGYMAANAVLRQPDVFKAAVAGAPVTDWEDYDTHYTERYLGLLPESRAAYDEASLIPLAKGLRRPLLLVHGTADDNVYFRHTLKLADALFRAGRPFEALPLPGVTHMYSADPVVMERLWARTAGFFREHLGGPK